jgi:hypothetical protein
VTTAAEFDEPRHPANGERISQRFGGVIDRYSFAAHTTINAPVGEMR